jgi:hypothetical protein
MQVQIVELQDTSVIRIGTMFIDCGQCLVCDVLGSSQDWDDFVRGARCDRSGRWCVCSLALPSQFTRAYCIPSANRNNVVNAG